MTHCKWLLSGIAVAFLKIDCTQQTESQDGNESEFEQAPN